MASQGPKLTKSSGVKERTKSKEKAVNKDIVTLERRTAPGQVLNARVYEQGRTDQIAANKGQLASDRFPIGALQYGHWAHGDSRDTEMQLRKQLIEAGGKDGNGNTPFGNLSVGADVLQYMKDKKDQEEYLRTLSTAVYLIDPTDPKSQAHAYSIFPELRQVPEDYHLSDVAMQEALRTILRDGQVKGKDDHLLLMKVCGPDYVLPTHALWDPQGFFSELTRDSPVVSTLVTTNDSSYSFGLFNPRNWGTSTDAVKKLKENQQQKRLKCMILKRCYPYFHKMNLNEVEKVYDDVLFKVSPVTNETVTNAVVPFWDKLDRKNQARYE